jgi:hypothetical protein
MKNFLLTLGLAVAACAVAFGVFYALNDNPALRHAARDNDAMAWLQAEFRLDEARMSAIRKLHEDYGAVCTEHCARITNARRASAPAAELARLEQACVDAMTAHFRQVAALMPPAEGERYLHTVLPRVSHYPHAGAPSVQMTH